MLRAGLRVDVQLARVPDASTCPDSSGGRVAAYLFQLGDSDFWLQEDERVRVLVLDVSATPLTLLVGAQNADYERTVVDADAVLTSIEFVSGE